MRHGAMLRGAAALPLLAAAWSAAPAQSSIVARVRAAGTRTIVLTTRARAEVCGDGATYLRDGLLGGSSVEIYGQLLANEGWTPPPCVHGPLRVTLRAVDGAPSRLQVSAGPAPAAADTVLDLGTVPAAEASAYLRDLARSGDGRVSEQALFPLLLVDSAPRWEVLAAAARDSTRMQRYRQRASGLLARGAASTLGAGAWADDPAAEQRRAAVRALATRRPRDADPVPDLLEIARTNRHADARAAAIRQLGQTADPRAIDLFAAMLGVR
jgi:hypothetical protein